MDASAIRKAHETLLDASKKVWGYQSSSLVHEVSSHTLAISVKISEIVSIAQHASGGALPRACITAVGGAIVLSAHSADGSGGAPPTVAPPSTNRKRGRNDDLEEQITAIAEAMASRAPKVARRGDGSATVGDETVSFGDVARSRVEEIVRAVHDLRGCSRERVFQGTAINLFKGSDGRRGAHVGVRLLGGVSLPLDDLIAALGDVANSAVLHACSKCATVPIDSMRMSDAGRISKSLGIEPLIVELTIDDAL
jgi:hypothetical protein